MKTIRSVAPLTWAVPGVAEMKPMSLPFFLNATLNSSSSCNCQSRNRRGVLEIGRFVAEIVIAQ